MKIIEAYALQAGLKIDKPILTEEYFSLTCDKFITIHTGGGDGKFDSKLYNYWDEVLGLMKPFLTDYKVLQIGDKDDRLVQGVDFSLLGQTSVKQCVYVLKKSSLHIGNDSFPVHVAGAVNVPVVSVYGPTTVANHGPYWSHPSSVLIESNRNGAKANFSRQESPKTVNMIFPETVANAALNILGFDPVKVETLFIGDRYGNYAFELIPDVLIHPNNLQNKNPTIRLDYDFNEENAFKTLAHTPSSLITNQPVNLDILKQLKKNVSILAFEVKDNTSLDYLLSLKHASLPLHLFSKEKDKKRLSDLRAKFFDVGYIDFLDENIEPIKGFESVDGLQFKSSKFIIGKSAVFSSYAHYLTEDKEFHILNENHFWKDKNFFWIYKNG